MWISEPMPVTMRIITDESGSSRSARSTLNSPDVIQVKADWTIGRSSTGSLTSPATATADTTNAATMAAHATAPDAPLLRRLPKLALMRKPRKGNSGISDSISARSPPRSASSALPHEDTKCTKNTNLSCTRSARDLRDLRCLREEESLNASHLPLQRREAVGVQRLPMPEQTDHDRESHGRFRGGDRHDEEHDDLPVRRPERPAERDEAQVDGVQHDLDREQDRDEVAPDEHARGADRKQDRRQHEVMVQTDRSQRRHRGDSRRASTTAPTIATRISTDVTSNAKP